jgi:hypothetical protein
MEFNDIAELFNGNYDDIIHTYASVDCTTKEMMVLYCIYTDRYNLCEKMLTKYYVMGKIEVESVILKDKISFFHNLYEKKLIRTFLFAYENMEEYEYDENIFANIYNDVSLAMKIITIRPPTFHFNQLLIDIMFNISEENLFEMMYMIYEKQIKISDILFWIFTNSQHIRFTESKIFKQLLINKKEGIFDDVNKVVSLSYIDVNKIAQNILSLIRVCLQYQYLDFVDVLITIFLLKSNKQLVSDMLGELCVFYSNDIVKFIDMEVKKYNERFCDVPKIEFKYIESIYKNCINKDIIFKYVHNNFTHDYSLREVNKLPYIDVNNLHYFCSFIDDTSVDDMRNMLYRLIENDDVEGFKFIIKQYNISNIICWSLFEEQFEKKNNKFIFPNEILDYLISSGKLDEKTGYMDELLTMYRNSSFFIKKKCKMNVSDVNNKCFICNRKGVINEKSFISLSCSKTHIFHLKCLQLWYRFNDSEYKPCCNVKIIWDKCCCIEFVKN